MALGDYYLCDVCGGKAFYDANLSYDFDREQAPVSYGCGMKLGYVGDMAVICDECAKTHTVAIIATPSPAVQAGTAQGGE